MTFPGRATGPEDSLPFGTEGLGDPGPSWGCHEPFGLTAGAHRVGFKATAHGHQTDQGPLESGRSVACGCPRPLAPVLLA